MYDSGLNISARHLYPIEGFSRPPIPYIAAKPGSEGTAAVNRPAPAADGGFLVRLGRLMAAWLHLDGHGWRGGQPAH